MYSIVINLTRPKLSQAIGIGFIAGLTLVPSSKSAFPLGNVASELLVRLFAAFWLRLCSKQVSANGSCVLLSPALLHDDQRRSVYFYPEAYFGLAAARMDYAMLPVVAIVGLLNGLITFFLYAPVRKLFYFQEDEK